MITRRNALLFSLCALVAACDRHERKPGLIEHAALGVFFGGQIQERDQIPFNVDRGKQTVGFRLELRQPATRALSVRWEINRPTGRGNARLTELGQAEIRPGARRFDQELPFRPGQALGTWNFRVLVESEIAVDRPILIYDAAERRKVEQEERRASTER